jgi:hypothetical protein
MRNLGIVISSAAVAFTGAFVVGLLLARTLLTLG